MIAVTSMRMLGAVIGAAAFGALVAVTVFSSTASATHSWGSYHWGRTSNPFTLQLGDNVSDKWQPYLQTAASNSKTYASTDNATHDWDDAPVLNVDPTLVASGKDPRKCKPTSGRVEVCNAKYGNNGWLGLAQIWTSGSLIVQGTAKMNDSYFNTSTYNKAGWRNLVMCQEIGHTFGLAHVNENNNNLNTGSCMDYTSDPDGTRIDNKDPWGKETNQYPNQHDYDQLGIIYNALDSTTTVGSATAASKMPPAANQGYFNSRAEWGALKQRSADGEVEIYERDFGGGNKVHTRVIRVVEKTPTPDSTGGNHDHHDHHDH